jgi:hypothetical protein
MSNCPILLIPRQTQVFKFAKVGSFFSLKPIYFQIAKTHVTQKYECMIRYNILTGAMIFGFITGKCNSSYTDSVVKCCLQLNSIPHF